LAFLETKYLYLILLAFSLAYPLAQSFEHRIRYWKNWKYLFPATTVMMLLFIPWDIRFTRLGIWWFNDRYTTGVRFLDLPLEEWAFFLVVPYACLFIYEVLNYYIRKDLLAPVARPLMVLLSIALVAAAFVYRDRLYPLVTFSLTSFALLLTALFNPVWKGRFLLAYLVCLLPFLLVNGALTGALTEQPVVNYNPAQITGYRIITIPVEDSIYNLLMLLMVVSVYEALRSSTKSPASAGSDTSSSKCSG